MDAATSRRFDLASGALCLDFANTIGDRPHERDEHLTSWADLVAWAAEASAIDAPCATMLQRWACEHPQEAATALDRAKVLRDCIYRVFASLAAGRPVDVRDIGHLNVAIGSALAHSRLVPGTGGFVWTWTDDGEPNPERPLWPVIRSAADLLVSPESAVVRECGSETCSWLFLDRSRTKRRRWCSMQTCGNRHKVRRFYERQRSSCAS